MNVGAPLVFEADAMGEVALHVSSRSGCNGGGGRRGYKATYRTSLVAQQAVLAGVVPGPLVLGEMELFARINAPPRNYFLPAAVAAFGGRGFCGRKWF